MQFRTDFNIIYNNYNKPIFGNYFAYFADFIY